MTQLGFATILVNMDGFFEKTVEYPAIDLPGVLNTTERVVVLVVQGCVVETEQFILRSVECVGDAHGSQVA